MLVGTPIFPKRKLELGEVKSFAGDKLASVRKREPTQVGLTTEQGYSPAPCRSAGGGGFSQHRGALGGLEPKCDLRIKWFEKGHTRCSQGKSRHYPLSLVTEPRVLYPFGLQAKGFLREGFRNTVQTHPPLLEKSLTEDNGRNRRLGSPSLGFTFKKMGIDQICGQMFGQLFTCDCGKPTEFPR